MRQIKCVNRRHSRAENRKVPLNTVILPPITPPPDDRRTAILRQIVVTKSNVGPDVMPVVKSQESPKSDDRASKSPEQVRLEQNIRFLQDQHQMMLAGLHGEIERLKAKNRELQFQLAFGKTSNADSLSSSSSTPTSEEDTTKHKLYISPKAENNTTPLQVEILEKELGELKVQVQEQEVRNVYLSAIVEEQKKQLERYDRRREKEQQQQQQQQQQQRTTAPGETEAAEMLRKLEDAENLIRRLRRENSDLRRENQNVVANEATSQNQQQRADINGYHSPRGPNHRGGSGRGHRSGGNNHNNGHYNGRGGGGWFPPLPSQSFWQGGRAQQDRYQEHHAATNLPDIPLNDDRVPASNHHQYHQGKKHSNNNHYHNGDGRKYRGGHHKGHKPS